LLLFPFVYQANINCVFNVKESLGKIRQVVVSRLIQQRLNTQTQQRKIPSPKTLSIHKEIFVVTNTIHISWPHCTYFTVAHSWNVHSTIKTFKLRFLFTFSLIKVTAAGNSLRFVEVITVVKYLINHLPTYRMYSWKVVFYVNPRSANIIRVLCAINWDMCTTLWKVRK
jgi:hypothetical protein